MADKILRKSLSAKYGWVTRLINEGNQLLSRDQLTPNKLTRLVENLKAKWASYQTTHESLEYKLTETANSEDYDDFVKEHEVLETHYLKELDKFETKLDELTATSSNGTSTLQNGVEQPKLTLPTITWDKFNGLIHQR